MFTVDSSDVSHLPLCTCGWRGHLVFTEVAALVQCVRHERTAHPDQRAGYDALRHRRRTPRPTATRVTRGAGGRFVKQTA